MKIKVKRVSEAALMPVRGSSHAAGYDLCAAIREELTVLPHTTVKVDTGLQMELPDGYFAGIFARSGIASREGLRPANCVGVCDSDYRGNYIVAIHNDSDVPRVIVPGEKIAQMIVLPYLALGRIPSAEREASVQPENKNSPPAAGREDALRNSLPFRRRYSADDVAGVAGDHKFLVRGDDIDFDL